MRKFLLIVLPFAIIGLHGCSESKAPAIQEVKRDTTITPQNAYSDLFFDSARLDGFLSGRRMPDTVKVLVHNFYKARNYQYAWFSGQGISEQAGNYYNILQDYISYSGDSVLYNPFLAGIFDSAEQNVNLSGDSVFRAELELSLSFLRYSRRAYQGTVNVDQDDLNWFIPRKRINTVAVMDSFLRHTSDRELHEPVNEQYRLLKEQLLRYYQLQQKGGFPQINITKKSLKAGDSAVAVSSIKRRLISTGDYGAEDTSALFNKELAAAVKAFQFRYGLKEDGVVGGTTLRYLNEPVEVRIRQILVNMERMRWIPSQPEGDFILVNIPQFRLTIFEGGKPVDGMNIVVGTSQNKTVIFTRNIRHVVFAPYWNVPPGIMKNEVLPAIRKDASYLSRNHMEWYNNTVRQIPGPWNALGKVKFLFPNSYNIYLHDTPAKGLFSQNKRAFSHGCIRVEEPAKLAQWILKEHKEWTAEKISQAMNGSKERFVNVKRTIPVFIGYFTAWVDGKGKLNFREDIYGHDKKLAAMMLK